MIKRFYLSILTLTALLCFGAGNAWGVQSLPYSYGFETDLLVLEDGWTKYFGTSLTSNNNECAIVGAAKKTGSYGFRFSSYQTQGDNAQYLISPEFSAPNGLDVTFQYAASSTYTAGETFKVGYSTTTADVSSFTWGAEISYKSTSWKAYENSFPAGTKYIAIYYYGNYQYRLYVDDFTFAATPSCVKPTSLTISSIRSTTATFTWTKGKDETSWQYVCLPAADALDWSGAATATSATATISGLTAEADYKLYVRSDCGSEQSPEVIKAFTTPCADYATTNLPLEENFNDKTAYPDCWSKVAFVSGTTSYPTIYSSNGESGSKSIRFYGGITGTSEQIAILPPIEEATGNLLLSFWYKNGNASSSYGQFIIGYITDPADASTFHQLGDPLTRNTGGTEVTKFAMTGAPENSFIAIKYAGGSYAQSAYIDNIKVSRPSSCADPSDVNAVAASPTTATVSWTENGSATAWNLQYSTDNFTTSTSVNGITENPYTLTGLTANTTYKVSVQADCGGDQSDWIESAAFPTPCEAVNGIGWSENFEDATAGSGKIPDCWQKITNNNSYPQVSSTASYQKAGSTKCLYFYGGVTGSSEQIAILPPFTEATNTLYVTLDYSQGYYDSYWEETNDYSGSNYGQLSVGYVTNSTFTPQESLPRVSAYATASVALTNAPAGSHVAIRYSGGSSAGYLFVDNITISAIPSCLAPSGVAGSATDVDEASISWTANGSETAWKITYSSDNGETWSDAVNAGTNPFILTGLSAKTTYIAKVKAKCGEEEFSEWSAPSLPFSTPCPPQAASYSFGFETEEGAVNGAFPTSECWKRITTSSYPAVYNYSAKTGSQCLRFYGSGTQYAILPQFNEDVKGLTLSFYYFNYSWGGALSVGYMTDPEDASTFVLVQDLANITSYAAAATEINLSGADAGARYIAFKYVGSESYHYSILDDVVVEKALSCQKPTDVEASNVTATTADVAWTENNSATTWKLQISNDGSAWTDVNGGADITTNPYQLTGLTPNHTTYYVRVKSVCGGGDGESNWSAASEPFETDCAVASLPFSENFSAANPCWTKVSCESSTGVNNGTFRFAYNTNPPQYLISPEINTEDKPVTVEFDYYVYSSGYPETFKVGYSTTTNEVSAFTWGATTTATNTDSPLTYSENLPAGVKYVAIQYLSNNMYYLYIDNFSVSEYVAPACPAINAATLEESNVTAHTATVSWTAGGEETAWNLQYKAAGGEWSDVIAISTTPSYDMSGLAENTLYYVRVQADCDGDGTSAWTGDEAFSFPTDCEPKAVSKASPWDYGFEDAADDAIPACWDRNEAYSGHGYPIVNEDSYNANTGDKYLYFYTPARNGGPAYTEDAILPVFNTDIKNLKVSFVYFNNSTGTNYGQLAVGYVSGNEFVQVGDLLAKVDDYTSVEREMPNNAPEGARIAIRCIGSTKSGYSTYVYVDDIVVSLKPTCYTPTALAAAETSDGAVLTWTAGKDENEWSVRYSVKDADEWTVVDDEITATNYTLTGLSVGTTYEVQVKAVCGVGDESAWSASAEFEPVCNAPSALAVTARTQNSATFSWTSSENAWVLQYSADGENWESENVAANPFTLNGLSAGQTYQAKIQSACGSDFSNIVMFTTWCDSKLSLPTNLTSFSAIPACWEESPAGAVSIASSKLCFVGEGEKFLYLPQTDVNLNLLSATFTFSGSLEFGYIDAPNGAFQAFETQPTSGVELNMEGEVAAAKYIAIRYNGASYLSQASISAVSIRKTPTCLAPTAVEATPGVGSASISWTNGGSEEAWNLQYKLASVASWDGAAQVAVSAKPFELNGLEQGVSYKVRVQAACAGEDPSDWSDEASFITDCEGIAALPWYADFSVALSNCWTIYAQDETYYKPAVNTISQDLQISGGKDGNSNNVVVLPAISASLTNAVLSFEYRGSEGASYAQLEAGYMTDKDDAASFTALETLAQAGSYTEARVALATVPAGKYLAFRYAGASSQGDQYIKNLRVINAYNFADNVDNSGTLAALNGQTVDVTIGRSFLCADYFNTICLPFSLSAEELAASPIASNDLWAFKYARVEGGELLIRIVEAESINAGEPYLISWPTGDNIENPLFKNVTISASAGKTMGNENLKFVGTLKPETFAAHDDSKLFLYQNNTLYWWAGDAPSNLKSFRAFFTVEGGADSMTIKHMPARIVRGEQVATGVSDVQGNVQSLKFLENDRVVIIRNGVKYSIQGQKIQ